MSNASDVEARGRRSEEPDDVAEDAFEMDRFLPRGRSGRKVNKTSDEDDLQNEGDEDEDEAKPFRRGGDEGLDPDDPITLVKRAVPETDDPTLPALTFRAVLIGSFFAILGSAVAQVSNKRTHGLYTSVSHPHCFRDCSSFSTNPTPQASHPTLSS